MTKTLLTLLAGGLAAGGLALAAPAAAESCIPAPSVGCVDVPPPAEDRPLEPSCDTPEEVFGSAACRQADSSGST